MSKSAVREDLRFFVLIREKIWESNRLKMSLQRYHVLSSELFKELGKSATNALCLLKRDDRFLSAIACLTCYPIFEKNERILFGKPVLWSASYLIKSNDNFQSGEHDVNQGTSLCLLHIFSAVPDYNCNDQEHGSCNQRQLYCDGCLGGAFSASLYLFVVSVTANPTDRAFVAWFTRIV